MSDRDKLRLLALMIWSMPEDATMEDLRRKVVNSPALAAPRIDEGGK